MGDNQTGNGSGDDETIHVYRLRGINTSSNGPKNTGKLRSLNDMFIARSRYLDNMPPSVEQLVALFSLFDAYFWPKFGLLSAA